MARVLYDLYSSWCDNLQKFNQESETEFSIVHLLWQLLTICVSLLDWLSLISFGIAAILALYSFLRAAFRAVPDICWAMGSNLGSKQLK